MRITVLGKSPSWSDAGGACSGYLVQEGDFTLLLDCGNGVFSKLRWCGDYVDVDAVPDQPSARRPLPRPVAVQPTASRTHRASSRSPSRGWAGTDHPARPDLYAPNGAGEVFRQITSTFGVDDLVERAFHLHPLRVARPARGRAVHRPPAGGAALHDDVRGGSGQQRHAGSPTAPTAGPTTPLVELARDTDLLMIEATTAASRAHRRARAISLPARRASTVAARALAAWC